MNSPENKSTFVDILGEILPLIDSQLAKIDVEIKQRPTQATIEFVRNFVTDVKEKDKIVKIGDDIVEVVRQEWFAYIYAEVHFWYEDRYPEAMKIEQEDHLTGVVSIVGSLFEVRVPFSTSQPGSRPGETIWLSLPRSVQIDEKPLNWVQASPNFNKIGIKEKLKAEKEVTNVANALRSIYVGLMWIRSDNGHLDGLIAGIKSNLSNAANMLLDVKSGVVRQACWELHFSCEQALKAVQQQRYGSHKEIHDLFILYDDLIPPPIFERSLLKKMPYWKEATKMRYGRGMDVSRHDCLKHYNTTLQIVAGSIKSMKSDIRGDARIEIQRPPWMKIIDQKFQTNKINLVRR